MKTWKIVLTALIAFSSEIALADNTVTFKYSGNAVGKQVCRAIVRDDVKQLQRVLRSHRSTLTYAYAFPDLASRGVAGSFTCNDMDLRDFSNSIGAEKISSYLAPVRGKVMEQQVVSVGK